MKRHTDQPDVFASLGYGTLAKRVYTTLLQHGKKSYSELARWLGVHRPALYDVIPRLLQDEIITSIRLGKRVVFQANHPDVLLALSKKRLEDAVSTIEQYREQFATTNAKHAVSLLEGKSGIRAAYEQLVKTTAPSGTLYRYESLKDFRILKEYYPEMYLARASDSGDIDKVVITNSKSASDRRKRLNRIIRTLPKGDAFEYGISEVMNEDVVVFVDYDDKTALVIRNKRFAQFQKAIFKRLFDTLPEGQGPSSGTRL